VLSGSMVGARVLSRTRSAALRTVFALVIGVLAIQMIVHGVAGRF